MTDEVKKKRHKLSDISFSHAGAHIALVGPLVGGPANQQETVLWKSASTEHIGEADIETVLKGSKSAEDVELEKAKFNSEVRESLRQAVSEQYASRYEWLYLEDFSDSQIVFSSDGGMFIVGYSLSGDDKYVIDDTAMGIEYKTILVENGAVRLSEKAKEKLDEGVYSLVTKALDNPETNDRVKAVITTIKEKTMQEEIQKAVDAAVAVQAGQIAELQKSLESAQAELATVAAEKQAVLMKAREASVAQFDKDGAADLVKATEALSDEAFAVVLKSLEAKAAVVAESDLMKQVSANADAAQVESSRTVEMLLGRAQKA